MKIAVIGGGAGGFFSAINIRTHHPQAQVFLFEKTTKLLSKVAVSGGGRCNVTHDCHKPSELAKFYPRGSKFLKSLFHEFSPTQMCTWLEERGVRLKVEGDGRIFPVTDSSQTIIDCFLKEAHKNKVQIQIQTEIISIIPQEKGFLLEFKNNPKKIHFDKVIVAVGGQTKVENFNFLSKLELLVEPPVPSLFTFNMPKNPITELMGVSTKASVRIKDTKLQEKGALLITHWGMSGPVILRLSAWGARILAEKKYQFEAEIAWIDSKEDALREQIMTLKNQRGASLIANTNFTELPKRLWNFLLAKAGIQENQKWADVKKQEINALVNVLLYDNYVINGKTTFKEEFVTCGGINLLEMNAQTMSSKRYPDLYFTGEVLDIDGITGGFNFQSAWTTAWIASQLG
ncbi:flavoprotein [bacterium 336/3]|nr:flavoprotein [bacterium 336/3]